MGRGSRGSNVPSSPPPGSDVESDIPSSQISPRNTVRIPRAVSGSEAARLERGRRPTYRAYRKIQRVDTPVHTRRKALAHDREAREAVQVKQKETLKQQFAKLKDFGKNFFGHRSVRAKPTSVKLANQGESGGNITPLDLGDGSGACTRVDGPYFVGSPEDQRVKMVPSSTDPVITAAIRRLAITARAEQRLRDGVSLPGDEKTRFPTPPVTELDSPSTSYYDADESEQSTADTDDGYLEETQILRRDKKGKADSNRSGLNKVVRSDRRNGYTMVESRKQSPTDLSLDEQPSVKVADKTTNTLSTYTEILPSGHRSDRQAEKSTQSADMNDPADNSQKHTGVGQPKHGEGLHSSDPEDPGDWLPWFQYPDIPGVTLGPRLQLYEYPELKSFRQQWMESRPKSVIGDADRANTHSRNSGNSRCENDTIAAESSGYTGRADADRANTDASRTRQLQQPNTLAKSPSTYTQGSGRHDGTANGISRKAMVDLEKAKAQLQVIKASVSRPNPGPSSIEGFSSVWDQVGSRPAPSGATSANLTKPNRPGSTLSTDTTSSYPDSTVTITNRDHTAFAVGNIADGVTRICLARDMPGLSEAVSDRKSPAIFITSESGNKRKVLPEGGSVTIGPAEPEVRDMYGAGPFRNGLMPSPSEGPSNVVRLEREGVTIYTTVDAVKEIQQEQKCNDGYTEKKSKKEPIASNSGPEARTSGPKAAVEKKRNRVAEWFNRFKDQEPIQPKVDNSVNSNQPIIPLRPSPSMDNTQRSRREPARPPNSENYTFTPRLPPPSVTAFVYRQDATEEPEDAHTNNPDSHPRFAPNRLLTIDMTSDTTALSPRAKKRLEESREVAIQQATVRLRQAQERLEAKRQTEGKPLQTTGKLPLEERDVAMEEAAIRLLRAQAWMEAKQAVKEAETSSPVGITENPPRNAKKRLDESREVAIQQATVRLRQAQERLEAKRQTEGKPLQTTGKLPLEERDVAMEEAAIRLLRAQAWMEAKQAAKEAKTSNPVGITENPPRDARDVESE